jgi:hypothetical protein
MQTKGMKPTTQATANIPASLTRYHAPSPLGGDCTAPSMVTITATEKPTIAAHFMSGLYAHSSKTPNAASGHFWLVTLSVAMRRKNDASPLCIQVQVDSISPFVILSETTSTFTIV